MPHGALEGFRRFPQVKRCPQCLGLGEAQTSGPAAAETPRSSRGWPPALADSIIPKGLWAGRPFCHCGVRPRIRFWGTWSKWVLYPQPWGHIASVTQLCPMDVSVLFPLVGKTRDQVHSSGLEPDLALS